MSSCKICHQKNHSKNECWMRFVLLNTDAWKKDNCGSPLQIDLCNVIKSPEGEKTNISSENKFSLKSSTNSIAVILSDSNVSLIRLIQVSRFF